MRKGSRMSSARMGVGGEVTDSDDLLSEWEKKGEVGVKTVWRREGGERERERSRLRLITNLFTDGTRCLLPTT